jgi:hypothetical protein
VSRLTATLTATPTGTSGTTCTILRSLTLGPDGRGCPQTICADLRNCECCCGAPGWRTTRLGIGDSM